VYSAPLKVLVSGFGYRLTDRMDELTPLQRLWLLQVWKKQHPKPPR